MTNTPSVPGTLLPVQAPPQLEQAAGYHGSARFFVLHWSPSGDEAEYNDGRMSGTGDWSGYLAFVNFPVVEFHINNAAEEMGADRWCLGTSETEATHCLVVDRETRSVHLAKLLDACLFLNAQWPAIVVTAMTKQDWTTLADNLMKGFAQVPAPDMAEIMAAMQKQKCLIDEMVAWLDVNYSQAEAAA